MEEEMSVSAPRHPERLALQATREKTAILLPVCLPNTGHLPASLVPVSSRTPEMWGTRLILRMCKLRLREMRHPAQGYYLRPSRVTYCPSFPRTEEFLEMQDFEDRTRQAEGLVVLGCLPAELCYTNCSPNRADSSDFPKSWL